MDKIAKTGIVPDEYKNVFRGVKNPQAQIKKAQSDIRRIDNKVHEEHIKKGEDYDDLCFVCNPSGKKRKGRKKKVEVEEIIEEEIIEEIIEPEVEVEEEIEEEEIIEDDWEKGW